MADSGMTGLLPEGLRDLLPPEAAHQEALVRRLCDRFIAFGYERVTPPLVEFEDSLLARLSAAKRLDMFRLLDPASQRLMALRSDMTGQVARIAATRLGHWPRPLRLSYAGSTLRVKGSQLLPERQIRQAGVELIGRDGVEAALEVLLVAAQALGDLGLSGLGVDLAMPDFVPMLCRHFGLDAATGETLAEALDAKDAGALDGLAADAKARFLAVLESAGPAQSALQRLQGLDLPATAAAAIADLGRLVAGLNQVAPSLDLSIDLGERRGFGYQSGLGFTFYAQGARGELGRGGCYGIVGPKGVEAATGFTLYVDAIAGVAAMAAPAARLLVPGDLAPQALRDLQDQGYVTLRCLDGQPDREEARRLRCGQVLLDGRIVAV